MFTNEIETDSTVTRIMDETAEYEDVEVIIDDDSVLIRQWNEDVQAYDLVTMTHKMYYELIESRHHGVGIYVFEESRLRR